MLLLERNKTIKAKISIEGFTLTEVIRDVRKESGLVTVTYTSELAYLLPL